MAQPSVKISTDPIELVQSFFRDHTYTRVAVLVDDNTKKHCYPVAKNVLPEHQLITVAAGEEYKTLETCSQIWSELTRMQFDRHSLLMVLGGGVLGDMGGFCAATFKRGIDFVLLPTTLLSQVDASVGGKLGIDFEGFKNHIGVFQEPRSTLIGTKFLETLPERELRSGFAEVIKHCLISDRAMWEIIKTKTVTAQNWLELVSHSINFKMGVTTRDPREKGERKILNFGHTIGHAVESLSFRTEHRLFHGEAIAMGMIAEAQLAVKKGLLSTAELQEIADYITRVYGKANLPPANEVIALMRQDKKNKGNKILLALPKGIGSAQWDVETSEEEIAGALAYYDSL